jgi:hypothetical protein
VGSCSPRRALTACRASARPALASSADRSIAARRGSLTASRPPGQLAGALQLDGQAGQRVGEHVVQLAGDVAAFGQRGRGGLGLPRVPELGQQQLGPVLALAAAPDELAGHREQQAQQHRGDGGLDRGLPGQADRHGERGRDRPGGQRSRDGRQPDRGDPHAQAGRYLDRAVRLQDGQRHPAAADQRDDRRLRGRAAAGPPDADRGQHGRGIRRQQHGHRQARAVQARRGMSLRARGHHHREEHHAQRPQRLPLPVAALAGARPRFGHPGRGGLAAVRSRRRTGTRGVRTKARRGRPCLYRHSEGYSDRPVEVQADYR